MAKAKTETKEVIKKNTKTSKKKEVKKAKEIEIGWGKYYGPMVERGTIKMKSSHPHLVPLWNRNSKRYIESFKKRNNL